jgi:hypothetical protein
VRRWIGVLAAACAAVFLSSCGGGTQPAASAAPQPQQFAAAPTPNVLDANALFDWASAHYPQYFSGSYQAGVSGVYTYRYYAATGNYVGVDSTNHWAWVLGPVSGGALLAVGTMSSFECKVFPANCPTPMPSSPLVALAGVYTGTTNGPSPNSLFIFGPDGRFVGYNLDASTTHMDVFYGTAGALTGEWAAAGATAQHVTYDGGGTPAVQGPAVLAGTDVYATSLSGTVLSNGVSPLVPLVGSSLSLTYNWQSSAPASLDIVGGVYSVPALGEAVTVNPSTGALTGFVKTNCSISGLVSVPDARRNIYNISATLSGTACAANASVQLLGYYYTADNGQQSLVMVATIPGVAGVLPLTIIRHG